MRMKQMVAWLLCVVLCLGIMAPAMADSLRYGDRGDDVISLQKRLISLGFLTGDPDGKYGPATESAVMAFQAAYGLEIDGVAGNATQNKLASVISGGVQENKPSTSQPTDSTKYFGGDYSTIRRDDVGERVTKLQKALVLLGYAAGTADGDFGRSTEKAVIAFQKDMDLEADGKAGKLTLQKIETFINADGTLKNPGTAPAPDDDDDNDSSTGGYLIPDRSLRRYNQGDDVASVQKRLKELGYYTGTVDGNYGKGTMEAVRNFQQRNGLMADGVAGVQTYAVLYSSMAISASSPTPSPSPSPAPEATPAPGGLTVPTRSLREGDVGSDVSSVQTRLKELGYYTGNVDADYGKGTVEAVRRFQDKHGLTTDGIAGTKTYKILYSDSALKADQALPAPEGSEGYIIPDRTLRDGCTGEDVKSLQKRLIELGYLTGEADGKYGSATLAAVSKFQYINGLDVDGLAGRKTCSVLFSEEALGPQTQQPAPETPEEPEEPETDVVIPTRTLRSGDSGDDVISVQTRLKELNYYIGMVDGKYGYTTVSAVIAFQDAHDLTADGVAGVLTYAKLFSADAKPNNTTSSGSTTVKPDSYTLLRRGSSGEAVLLLQRALLNLGYATNTNGNYDYNTVAAVKAFQSRNNLSADGVAGELTQMVLYSEKAVPADTETEEGPGSTTAGVMNNPPSSSQVKLLHWYDDLKGKQVFHDNNLQIYDPASGLTWYCRVGSMGQHADCEPVTLQDTQIMYKAFGNRFTWDEKPVYIKLTNGTWCIASMHDMPHESDWGKDDAFVGHLCIHFPRTMSECELNAPKNGVRHQKDIRKHWLKITGQEIPW
ncbi:MAG: hypothetical protein E7333_03730 [Clostridiales bacterium]|nr:hypothetical protein [Clostridiales bacterium]